MNTEAVERILKEAIGLDAASIGSSAVARAALVRAKALGCVAGDAYLDRLRNSTEERQALIEQVVVPETWFFRDPDAFALLARRVQPPVGPRESVWRILSVPCATGEEPYSIAMTLLDAGVPRERCHIEAIDVSEIAISRARAATFGRNSFRGADLGYRDRHFAERDGRWSLDPDVAQLVHFSLGNLLDPAFATQRAPYAFVFCRNLLIYFDRATQDRAVAALAAVLADGGVLFVGPSETALFLDHGFEMVRAPLAFAVTKANPMGPKPAKANPEKRKRATRPPFKPTPKPPREHPRSAVSPTVSRATKPLASPSLDEIARLAGGGHLVEAGRLCEEYLRHHGKSAQALYLLGVVRDASGKHDEATELYRRAIYLDPRHHDALMHLSYLLEAKGDTAGAQVLAARARRVAQHP